MYYCAQSVSGAEALARIVEYWADVVMEMEIDGKVKITIGNDGTISVSVPEPR